MSRRDQLLMMIEHFASGNKAEFARILSISPQNLNSWLKNGYVDIERVFKSCHGISAEWLITGEGEMLTEKRPLNLLSQDVMIPFLNTQDVLDGLWQNPWHFVIVRGYEFYYSFFTRMPGRELVCYIPHGSILGCKIIKPEELKEKFLYIVRTKNQGVFFVQYLGEETSERASVHKFTTRRGESCAELVLALPTEDIAQCAEIEDYTINHHRDNLYPR
ncbi:MAG: hypothetical protein J6L98_04305 [Bacteroidales bacterium]|nr:hypothetical protein [Bacteroidales bacterium]